MHLAWIDFLKVEFSVSVVDGESASIWLCMKQLSKRSQRKLLVRSNTGPCTRYSTSGYHILPSKYVSDAPSMVCLMQLLKAKYKSSLNYDAPHRKGQHVHWAVFHHIRDLGPRIVGSETALHNHEPSGLPTPLLESVCLARYLRRILPLRVLDHVLGPVRGSFKTVNLNERSCSPSLYVVEKFWRIYVQLSDSA